MKKTIKSLLSIMLVICMVLQYVPGAAFALGTRFDTDVIEAAPDADLPGNDDLFAMYVEQTLYGIEWATFGTAARENLNTAEQAIYDAMKAEIEKVAAGGGSTEFVFASVPGLKMEWTREELGVESIEDVTEAKALFAAQFSLNKIFTALLSDCPYDLYWYDKTVGGSMGYSMSRSGISSGGTTYWTKLTFKDLTIKMNVASAYQGDADFTVTTDVAKVTTAKVNAQAIVDANAAKTAYEKLAAYKEAICEMVSYNHAAADDSYTGGYGDPWQLIYVFDGDTATEVVCEGYAKAFQYLCDLGGLDCISVSGVMAGGTGAGGHMWNIVTLDGENYLVDVTNCDEGTIGAPDALFLVGNPDGSVADGYVFAIGGQNIGFNYDSDILDTWTEEELTLAESDYDPAAAGCAHSYTDGVCTLCGAVCAHDAYENGFCAACDSYQPCEGAGTPNSPYLIANAGNLYWFQRVVNYGIGDVAKNVDAEGKLTADIVVNENVLAEDGSLNAGDYRTWTPIGRETSKYGGSFNGDGHSVSGLYYNITGNDYVGLFGYLDAYNTIENVSIRDSYISGRNYVGGVVGYFSYPGSVRNCSNAATVKGSSLVGGVMGNSYKTTMTECSNTGVVEGIGNVGGVVGYAYMSTLRSCCNEGTVTGTGDRVGGILGSNNGSTLTDCGNTAAVTGADRVGGVVGSTAAGKISGCSNTGAVSGESYAGGVAGYAEDTVEDCGNSGAVTSEYYAGGIAGRSSGTVQECHNSGEVTAERYYAAGVAAMNTGDVLQCRNEGTISADDVGGIVGSNGGNVENCVNAGKITGLTYVGGIVSENNGTVTACENTGSVESDAEIAGGVVGANCESATVTACRNKGAVSGSNSVGGIVGMNTGAVENCSNEGEITAGYAAGGIVGLNYKIDTGEEYPDPSVTGCYNVGTLNVDRDDGGVVGGTDGSCTVTNSYYLDSAETDSLEGTAFMTADQFASGEVAYLLGAPWGQTIGTDGLPVLNGETVYQNVTTDCTGAVLSQSYSNTQGDSMVHTLVSHEAKAPTCTEAGWDAYVTCSGCDYSTYVEIPALGHAYDKGICTVCGSGVVVNTATGIQYGTLAEALAAAEAGQTLQLQMDWAEDRVMVFPGVTLDLNGYDLTVEYLVAFDSAHVIDDGGTGSLITGQRDVVLDENNSMIPVYNGEAYIFTRAGFAIEQDLTYTEGVLLKLLACPVRMDAVELLKDGSTDNGIRIVLLLSWDTADGTSSQEFVFSDDFVTEVFSSNKGTWSRYGKQFTLTLTGTEGIQNLKADMMIVSDTDVVYVSTNGITIS